jgi:CBS domain-containing protein
MEFRCPKCRKKLPVAIPSSANRVMDGTPVSRIMIKELVTVDPDTPVLDAARTLLSQQFGALPVVSGGRLVGILTDVDLIRCLEGLLANGR